ncbi:alcohol dehydrogenase GroES domain protein [Hyaloraphidium curvatum]|nr:alcohol dehydrogenase GroES domain protein [Hyaloraphidium curvatum]
MSKKVSQKFPAVGQPLKRVEEDLPVPKGDEVLIKVTSAGVCHSDIHIHEGTMDMGTMKLPYSLIGMADKDLAMGHEIVGSVVAVGPDAKGIEIGKSYIAWPWGGCGKTDCAACEAGLQQCPNGSRYLGCAIDGGFSTHCLVPRAKYLVPYSGITEEFACTLACSGLTAYGAIKKSLVGLPGEKFDENNRLCIFGAGGLGLQAIRIVKALFPDYKPTVADIDPKKRQAALDAGAGEAAAPMLRLGGATLTVVGLFGGLATIPVTMLVMGWTLQGHGTGTLGELQELAKLASDGKLDPIPISKRKLEEANEILKELGAGKIVGRAVIKPQEQ